MANRIKGITVEIGGDTTKLQTALKGVNGEIKNTQAQLKDVEKLLKLDPGNTELFAQKHRLLGQLVEGTKGKLETLKTAAEQANMALANGEISQGQYDALQREIIETENELKSPLAIKLSDHVIPFLTGLVEKITAAVDAFANMNPAVQKAVLVVGGIIAVTGPLLIIIGKERIQEMIEYLKSQPKRVAAYDEQLVRKLIEKITVYDDHLDFLFKSEIQIEIRG